MQLRQFFPYALDDIVDIVLAIQVNIFKCGGIAIGVCISHKVADALSVFMFVNGWAAVARWDTDMVCPQFGLAILFPPINLSGFNPITGMTKEKILTKRFVFSASRLAALRENTTEDLPRRPPRIEALSAFICSRFKRVYTILHVVNLHTRMEPPLHENYFGNIVRFAITTPCMDGMKEGQCHALHLNFLKERAEKFTKGEIESFRFTSLSSLPFRNLVVFMDSSGSNGGIEAWINFDGEA
ncbi:hypothetical protein PVL29_001253 [Vitis rotundifolia]|uniref:Vinorine synthase n=1 Tax=Vitis rotundifolia TaxID=103349 RepID=A0AA39AL55_VITRO|nr:hypothetical protein PVL29_001253 [Vitis rotundifolia]